MMKSWALELKRRYLDGIHLLAIQIAMASEALGEVWKDGKCFKKGESNESL